MKTIDDHIKEREYLVAVELGYIPESERADWRKQFFEATTEDELSRVLAAARSLSD